MDLVVLERDVVLVHSVPLLDPQLLWPCARLRSQQLFQITHCVFLVALHTDLLSKAVVTDDLNHHAQCAPQQENEQELPSQAQVLTADGYDISRECVGLKQAGGGVCG
eukprot:CAMPEP_0183350000 /NCGR_PEP_ID=MMETSP0164_2-20130417/15779_1 /TAXON_ID=221442 /ORGANISM="Coccolithus pelagicus ssp braarudi, Strain PLY182g" /LENGTH=107 /DNA_ID=CAMNT_0025521837 /DNA_START=375 /DNA_END=698 /DNA_ORIENTATION=+